MVESDLRLGDRAGATALMTAYPASFDRDAVRQIAMSAYWVDPQELPRAAAAIPDEALRTLVYREAMSIWCAMEGKAGKDEWMKANGVPESVQQEIGALPIPNVTPAPAASATGGLLPQGKK